MAGENHVCATPAEQDAYFNRPEINEPLHCNYCDELFDGEQLKPTFYNKKFMGLVCPECLTELNNSNKMEAKYTKGTWRFVGKTLCAFDGSNISGRIVHTEPVFSNKFRTEEAKANKQIIEAAPETKTQRDELLEALKKAKEIIKEWHNMGCNNKNMKDGLWAIYDEKSPEMKPINQAIKNSTNERQTKNQRTIRFDG